MSFRQENVVIIEPQETHRASIIWLHGLGADGHDFESIVPELNLSNKLGIRFIFPNAPIRQITINNNMKMRGWYDIKSTNLREIEDVGSIIESSNLIHGYIDTEVKRGIKSNKIIVAGFLKEELLRYTLGQDIRLDWLEYLHSLHIFQYQKI